MDAQTILSNSDIFESLVKSYLYRMWQDTDESGDLFVIKCVELIIAAPRGESERIKILIQASYPVQWPRIEKLIVLK